MVVVVVPRASLTTAEPTGAPKPTRRPTVRTTVVVVRGTQQHIQQTRPPGRRWRRAVTRAAPALVDHDRCRLRCRLLLVHHGGLRGRRLAVGVVPLRLWWLLGWVPAVRRVLAGVGVTSHEATQKVQAKGRSERVSRGLLGSAEEGFLNSRGHAKEKSRKSKRRGGFRICVKDNPMRVDTTG